MKELIFSFTVLASRIRLRLSGLVAHLAVVMALVVFNHEMDRIFVSSVISITVLKNKS